MIIKCHLQLNKIDCIFLETPCRAGLRLSMSTSHTIGRGFASRPGHTIDHHINGTNCFPALHACVRVGV